MIQELKKKFLGKSLFMIIFMLVLGIAFMTASIVSIMKSVTPSTNLNSLYADEVEAGMNVEVTVDYVIDYYAYTEENYQTIEKEYIIPIGEEEYMGLVASGSDMNKLDNIMYFTQDYIEGDEDALDNIEPLVLEGTVRAITGESKEFYREYLSECGWTDEEIDQYFIPYAVMVGNVEGNSAGSNAIIAIVGFICALVGVITLIRCLVGSTVKPIKKYCDASANPEATMQRLDTFYHTTPEVHGVRVSRDYFLSTRGINAQFCDVKNIIWVYEHVVRHSVYFIPVGKTYSIMIMTADGKRIEVTMSGKKKTEAVMEYIGRTLPFIYVGYSNEIAAYYSKNRQEMINAVAERRKEFIGLEM